MLLVGRERELAEIARFVDRAERGHGGLLVVVGPADSGKTAVADAAAEAAHTAGVRVVRTTPKTVGALLVDDAAATRPVHGSSSSTTSMPMTRLRFHSSALAAERVATSTTAIVATSREPLGLGPECVLRPLSEEQLALALGPGFDAETVGAIHLAARGATGRALALAETLQHAGVGDPVAYLALHVASVTEFLDVDATLVRLLELARTRPLDAAVRARITSRLARELIGDPTAARTSFGAGRRGRRVGSARR